MQDFVDAFTINRVLSEVIGGLLFGFFAFGRPVTIYTKGIVDVSGYAQTTAVTCLLIGSLFFIPALLDPKVSVPRLIAGALLWIILSVSLGAGIWLKLHRAKRQGAT